MVAAIPGIIEGAHEGKGLGLKFLQHVERTRVLAFLVPLDSPDPQHTYEGLRDEIRSYSEALYEKPHLVILTKRDLLPADAGVPEIVAPAAAGVLTISSAAGMGLDDLKEALWSFVEEAKGAAAEEAADDRDEYHSDWDGEPADGTGVDLDDLGAE